MSINDVGNLFMDYTDEQIEKLGNSNFNYFVIKEARKYFVDKGWKEYNENEYLWNSLPLEDVLECELCYEWKRYPRGQRHFGYAWFRKCGCGCNCDHHKNEIWMA